MKYSPLLFALLEISVDFVGITQENFNEKTNHLLDTIGRFFQADRTYMFLFNHENNTMAYTHEWCSEGTEPEIGVIQDVPCSAFPWWTEKLKNNTLIRIEDVNQLPAEADAEKKWFKRRKVKSLVSIPIEGMVKVQGFLGMDVIMSQKKWSWTHIKVLKILTNLLANGIVKIKTEEEIKVMAYYDQLTGLPNRILFMDRLNQAIHLAKRSGKLVAVMFIDLDNFKAVNDAVCHHGGDILIREVAQKLAQRLRKADAVARFGGDEFLILMNNIPDDKSIMKVADSIMRLFDRPFDLAGQKFFITGSAGIACYPVDGEDAETLIKNADIAMYKAKSKGKKQYVLYAET